MRVDPLLGLREPQLLNLLKQQPSSASVRLRIASKIFSRRVSPSTKSATVTSRTEAMRASVLNRGSTRPRSISETTPCASSVSPTSA